MKYAFLPGRNPELSIAELGAFFGTAVKTSPARDVIFVEGMHEDAQRFLNRLGGCTQMMEILREKVTLEHAENALAEDLLKMATARPHQTQETPQSGKFLFALNILPEPKQPSRFLARLLVQTKKNLRAKGVKANFLNKEGRNANEVAVKKQGLVESGASLWILPGGSEGFTLAKTIAIQDFEAYGKRDYGKPFRDARAGMLPPKLAQIMINLTAAPLSSIIYDPFCGTGTVLMEAILMGYSVIGSDTDSGMVEGTKRNIDWLRQIFPKDVRTNTDVKLFQKDATEVQPLTNNNVAPFGRVDGLASLRLGLATEPFLGPPLSQFPPQKTLAELQEKLGGLYEKFFRNLATWLQKGSPVIFIFPYWKGPASRRLRLSERLIAKIEALGYSKTAFVPLHTDSLFYDRPDSVVGREIVRFVKK